MLEKTSDFSLLSAKDIMSANPKTIGGDVLVVDALEIMKTKNISQLVVVENDIYAGIIHIHDLIREGII